MSGREIGGSVLDLPAGTHINEAVRQLVEAAIVRGREVRASFNGITIHADPTSTIGAILARWEADQDAATKAYRTSPAGRRQAREAELRRADLQARADRLVEGLLALDMASDVAVLGWLCEFQPASDHSGVRYDRSAIVIYFARYGFEAGATTGAAYRADDRDNSFRYLVGQALDGLENGPAIHPILLKFADEWRARFASTPLPDASQAGGR